MPIDYKRSKILVVDDQKENVLILIEALGDEFAVVAARSGEKAIAIAMTAPHPDLILLDVVMPNMDGYEVCKALKADAATQRIPVIFVTSLLDPGDETRGFEAGGVDYITKPFIDTIVRNRVKAHLALKKAHDDLEEWNDNLKKRLLQSIANIRIKTEALMSAEECASELHGYVQSLELLSGVFELMNDRFGVSSRAVSELAGDAARRMGLCAEDVAKVRLAGLLHDAGALGAGRLIQEKHESEMTSNELKEFRSHPERGQELFASLEELHDVGLMVRNHHEAYNGSGFPDGIREDDIPLGARLIAIANFIERAASSVLTERDEYALMNVRLLAGTQFDPRLITYFTMITRVMYFDRKTSGMSGEVEVTPNDLISGMQLSRDLSNDAGVLLLQKDKILDSVGIALIRHNSRANKLSKRGVWMIVGTAAHR
jgi:putative two-component system response regulator